MKLKLIVIGGLLMLLMVDSAKKKKSVDPLTVIVPVIGVIAAGMCIAMPPFAPLLGLIAALAILDATLLSIFIPKPDQPPIDYTKDLKLIQAGIQQLRKDNERIMHIVNQGFNRVVAEISVKIDEEYLSELATTLDDINSYYNRRFVHCYGRTDYEECSKKTKRDITLYLITVTGPFFDKLQDVTQHVIRTGPIDRPTKAFEILEAQYKLKVINNNACASSRSLYQILAGALTYILSTLLKAYVMIISAYDNYHEDDIKTNRRKSGWQSERQSYINEWYEDFSLIVAHAKLNLQGGSRDVLSCDPDTWILGTNYFTLHEYLTDTVFFSSVINPNGISPINRKDIFSKYCDGYIYDCEALRRPHDFCYNFTSNHLVTVLRNNEIVYGKNGIGQYQVYCTDFQDDLHMCTCEYRFNNKPDHVAAFCSKEWEIWPPRVIVSVSFYATKLVMCWRMCTALVNTTTMIIDPTTVECFLPSTEDLMNPIKLHIKEVNEIQLDDVYGPSNSFMRGMQFILKEGRIMIRIKYGYIDNVDNFLTYSSHVIEGQYNKSAVQLKMKDPDVPTLAPTKNAVKSTPGHHYIAIRTTSRRLDAGQSPIPYFDAQPFHDPNALYPLAGIGIYWKSPPLVPGSDGDHGGFLGIKGITVDVTETITDGFLNIFQGIFNGNVTDLEDLLWSIIPKDSITGV